jgi:His/Glu/Gln/Arg/opine family amino acid ABC transporter permease subunit
MNFAIIWENMPYLLKGLSITLRMSVIIIFAGAFFGILIGIMRNSQLRLMNKPALIYIEIIRGTPLLVVLFVVYFAVPALIGKNISAVVAATIGFIVFISAYIAEDVRSGLNSIPKGQIEAGLASGLNNRMVLIHIILPQAIRRMIPTFFNQFVRLTKFTSVASIIGVIELTGAAGIVNAREFIPLETYTTLACIYFVICYSLSAIGRFLNKSLAVSA